MHATAFPLAPAQQAQPGMMMAVARPMPPQQVQMQVLGGGQAVVTARGGQQQLVAYAQALTPTQERQYARQPMQVAQVFVQPVGSRAAQPAAGGGGGGAPAAAPATQLVTAARAGRGV